MQVRVDVSARSSEPLVGYSFAVGHDPARVTLVDVDAGPEIIAHGAELVLTRIDNEAERPFAAIIVVLDANEPLGNVPPFDLSSGTALATLVYDVLPETPEGETAELVPGHRVFGEPPVASILINEALDSNVPELCPGSIELRSPATFVRGNCNSDLNVSISDVIFILDFLYRRGAPPLCTDACDANDDGQLDVSDPIRVLLYLFAGSGDLPPPFPGAGADPTADPLGCPGLP